MRKMGGGRERGKAIKCGRWEGEGSAATNQMREMGGGRERGNLQLDEAPSTWRADRAHLHIHTAKPGGVARGRLRRGGDLGAPDRAQLRGERRGRRVQRRCVGGAISDAEIAISDEEIELGDS